MDAVGRQPRALGHELVVLAAPVEPVVPVAVEDHVVGQHQVALELFDGVSVGAAEEVRLAADDAVGRLEHDLHRAQLKVRPLLADVAAVRPVGRLEAHRERTTPGCSASSLSVTFRRMR